MSNESYLREITDELAKIPQNIAVQVGSEIFEQCVQATRVDSGQAAANWRFEPYQGSPTMDSETIMWGYANVDPIHPVGYKWAMYDNSEAVYRYQFEQVIERIAAMPEKIDGILVYNPITVGFAGFTPGSDAFYPENAFKGLNMDAIVASALARAYENYSQSFGESHA